MSGSILRTFAVKIASGFHPGFASGLLCSDPSGSFSNHFHPEFPIYRIKANFQILNRIIVLATRKQPDNALLSEEITALQQWSI